jgi:hypothetical protein
VGLLRLWLGAELRRRWRGQVALALLIGAIGAVVVTTAAGAHTTAGAYSRFVRDQAIPDVEMDSLPDPARDAVAHLPDVKAAGAYAALFAAPAREGVVPGRDFIVFAAADAAYGRTIDRPIVLDGRLPDANATDEAVVNESAARIFKFKVGSRTALTTLGADERDAFLGGQFDQVTFHGPKPTVRVVGVVRTRLDLGHASYARSYFVTTPAFDSAYASQIGGFSPQLDVLLKNPAVANRYLGEARDAVGRTSPEFVDEFSGNSIRGGLTSIRDATRVQALALGLVAFAAACAGLLALAQVVTRSVSASSDDFPALQAIGLARRGRTRLIAGSFVPAAVTGTVLAVVAAWVASPLFPTGVARRVGPPPGVRFDALTLIPGAVLLLVVVLAVAALSAYRWRPDPFVGTAPARVGPLDRLAGTLPPAPRIGFRWALPRRDLGVVRGRAAVAGAVVGVCALVAALTYWAGLDHLVTTPSAYGWTFDVDGGGGNDPDAIAAMRDNLLRNPVVGDVAVALIAGSVHIDSTTGDIYGFQPVRGHIGPTVLKGRAAEVPDEILLGTKTARTLHKGVGSTVTLLAAPGGQPSTLHVVGIGVLPTIESDRFANGGAMTGAGFEQVAAKGQPPDATPSGSAETVFRLAPGVDRSRALAALRRENVVDNVASPPGDIRNLDLVRAYPLWLAGFLALLGLLAVLHALLVSARRRSHQVGVLRALGLTRGQIVEAVSTQGGTMCVVGTVVGVPLGIALGRLTWAASAHQLGVGEGVTAPLLVVLGVIAAGLVVLLSAGATAGWWAGRATPGRALRAP